MHPVLTGRNETMTPKGTYKKKIYFAVLQKHVDLHFWRHVLYNYETKVCLAIKTIITFEGIDACKAWNTISAVKYGGGIIML